MKWKLLSALILMSSLAQAETLKSVFNPHTGLPDFITRVDSATLPSGSTQYIQNNPASQQTNSSLNIDGEAQFDHAGFNVYTSSPSSKPDGSYWLAKDSGSIYPCFFFFYNGARYHMCGCPEGEGNNTGQCIGFLCGVTYGP